MTRQPKTKIFLEDERAIGETKGSKSRHTFNFGQYFNEHKQPFGDLHVLGEEELDAGCSLDLCVEEFNYLILLPVIGAIVFKDSEGNSGIVAAGQMQLLTGKGVKKITISNAFNTGAVKFLQLRIKSHQSKDFKDRDLSTYDINRRRNGLLNISPSYLPFSLSIGKFDGRGETNYRAKSRHPGIFSFIIEGAFEMQGTLLHAGDGLALWNTDEIEMEALSNDAIILLVELSL